MSDKPSPEEAGSGPPALVLDHVGIAVRSLEEGVEHWRRVFGYVPMTVPVENARQKVRVVFLHKKGSLDVKLVEPSDESSPLHAFVRRGGGLHHLCFRCANINDEWARLAPLGLRMLCPPAPGDAFEDERIAFVYAGQGLNIELIETEKRARRLT